MLRNSALLGSLVFGLFVGGANYEIKVLVSPPSGSNYWQVTDGWTWCTQPYHTNRYLPPNHVEEEEQFDFNFSVKETRQVGSLVTVFGKHITSFQLMCVLFNVKILSPNPV